MTSGSTGALQGATRKKYSPEAGVERSGGCLRERSPGESGILGRRKVEGGLRLHRGMAHKLHLFLFLFFLSRWRTS